MIIIKIMGAVITILGTAMYGYMLAGRINERIKTLSAYKESLIIMEGYIRCAGDVMPEIFKRIAGNTDNEFIKEFYLSAGENLRSCVNDTFSQVINRTLEKRKYKDFSDMDMFIKMCDMPVYLDVGSQLRFLQEIVLEVEGRLNCLKDEYLRKSRVYKSLGISAGVLIVLVLI